MGFLENGRAGHANRSSCSAATRTRRDERDRAGIASICRALAGHPAPGGLKAKGKRYEGGEQHERGGTGKCEADGEGRERHRCSSSSATCPARISLGSKLTKGTAGALGKSAGLGSSYVFGERWMIVV